MELNSMIQLIGSIVVLICLSPAIGFIFKSLERKPSKRKF